MSNSKAHDMEVKVEAMDKASVDKAAICKAANDDTAYVANKDKHNEHHHHHDNGPAKTSEKSHKK
jgi:hypothetical protein